MTAERISEEPSPITGSLLLRHALLTALAVILSALGIAAVTPSPSGGGVRRVMGTESVKVPDQPEYSLTGVGVAVTNARAWYKAAKPPARVVPRKLSYPRSTVAVTSTPSVTGSCAEMKPPGFPDYIIQRESGGNPNARNRSGAFGCVQLMPGTGGSGTYAERWARTWANGAGACNWQAPRYCAR